MQGFGQLIPRLNINVAKDVDLWEFGPPLKLTKEEKY